MNILNKQDLADIDMIFNKLKALKDVKRETNNTLAVNMKKMNKK